MTEVFLARRADDELGRREVALKRLLPDLATDPQMIEVFVQEARIAADVDHPNVVRVSEHGEVNGRVFVARDFVDGVDCWSLTLRSADSGVPLEPELAIHIVCEVLQGLAYIHEMSDEQGRRKATVHGDVSPSNIFVSRAGEVKLGDFGFARRRHRELGVTTSRVESKVGYLAPEHVLGLPCDHRGDIFAAGTTLAELLIGENLFVRKNQLQTLLAISEVRLERLKRKKRLVPQAVKTVLEKALAKDPAERFQDAAEMKAALDPFLRDVEKSVRVTRLASIVGRVLGGEHPPAPPARPTPGNGGDRTSHDPKTLSGPPPLPSRAQSKGGTGDPRDGVKSSHPPPLPPRNQPAQGTGSPPGGDRRSSGPPPLPRRKESDVPVETSVVAPSSPPTSDDTPTPIPDGFERLVSELKNLSMSLETPLPQPVESAPPITEANDRAPEQPIPSPPTRRAAESYPDRDLDLGQSPDSSSSIDHELPVAISPPELLNGPADPMISFDVWEPGENLDQFFEDVIEVDEEYDPSMAPTVVPPGEVVEVEPGAPTAVPDEEVVEVEPAPNVPQALPAGEEAAYPDLLGDAYDIVIFDKGAPSSIPPASGATGGSDRDEVLGRDSGSLAPLPGDDAEPVPDEPVPREAVPVQSGSTEADRALEVDQDEDFWGTTGDSAATQWHSVETVTFRLRTGAYLGPMSYAAALDKVLDGEVSLDDLVSLDGHDFVSVSEVKELAERVTGMKGDVAQDLFQRPTPLVEQIDSHVTPDKRGLLIHEPLVRVLYRLAVERETGLLVLDLGAIRKELSLLDGNPHAIRSNIASESLSEYLVRREVLSRMELEMAYALQARFNGDIEETIVGLGLVEAPSLNRFIVDQIQDSVLDLLSWSKGEYTFYRGRSSEHDGFLKGIKTLSLLWLGMKRALDLESARIWLERHNGDTVYRGRNAEVDFAEFEVPEAIAKFLRDLIREPVSVGASIGFPGAWSDVEGYERVLALHLAKDLEVVEIIAREE